MNEFENIQRLIRLKRFEQPEEGFTENFLQQFHQRQRAELLKQSSVELLMERFSTWWSNLLVPKWSLATAALAVCAVSAWMLSRPGETPGAALTSSPAASEKPFVSKMDLSELPLARTAGPDEGTRSVPAVEGKAPAQALRASATGGFEKPQSKNAIPAVQSGTESGLRK
ncbi:hypothetical protein [Prosthecobacter sp.]|uniref:hypothetical protein n=1 Tax=Prosthecobacter sp. TaxID=1965333 RepID=UPI00378351C6